MSLADWNRLPANLKRVDDGLKVLSGFARAFVKVEIIR
jgi:hypothetical protein